jgi:hypothetical protein
MSTEPNPNSRAAPPAAADPAQIAEVNRVGLKVLRADAAAGRPGLPAAVRELRGEWAALDDEAIARAASAPFLLFAVDLDGALRAPSVELAGPQSARPAGRAFARMAVHYAWYVSTAAPAAAPLALGLSVEACARLRGLGLERMSALAEAAEHWVQLRWSDDARAWAERLEAARSGNPGALWASTLVGLQRLAGGLARAGR